MPGKASRTQTLKNQPSPGKPKGGVKREKKKQKGSGWPAEGEKLDHKSRQVGASTQAKAPAKEKTKGRLDHKSKGWEPARRTSQVPRPKYAKEASHTEREGCRARDGTHQAGERLWKRADGGSTTSPKEWEPAHHKEDPRKAKGQGSSTTSPVEWELARAKE